MFTKYAVEHCLVMLFSQCKVPRNFFSVLTQLNAKKQTDAVIVLQYTATHARCSATGLKCLTGITDYSLHSV